jgi:hypothetical protein
MFIYLSPAVPRRLRAPHDVQPLSIGVSLNPCFLQGARSFFGVSFLSIMFLAMGSMPQLAITFMNKT